MAASSCSLYRPRQPRTTPLYRLVEAAYDDVRAEWEERFEGRYGFWRSSIDTAVGAYLDCGLLDNGFARVRCDHCRAEYLVAFSCKDRGMCPSCAAKRAAVLAAFLREPSCYAYRTWQTLSHVFVVEASADGPRVSRGAGPRRAGREWHARPVRGRPVH